MRHALVRICWVWFGLTATARADPQDPLTRLVDTTLRAVRAGDTRALRTIARQDVPGLWLLADELCARDEADAALVLAKSARPNDATKLPAYVKARRKAKDDKDARERLHRAFALLPGPSRTKIRAVVDSGPIPNGTVVGYQLRFLRATSLLQSRELLEGAEELRRAGREAQAVGDLQTASYAYEVAGAAFFNAGLYADSQALLKRQIEMDGAREDVDRRIEALNKLVRVQRWIGETDELCDTYELLIAAHRDQDNEEGVCLALLTSAIFHLDAGRTGEALRRVETGLAMTREILDDAIRSQAYSSAASVYMATGNMKQALVYARKALEANIEEEDESGQAISHVFIGTLLDQQGERDEVEKHYQQAIELARSAGNKAVLVTALSRYAEFQASLDNDDAAVSLAREATDLARASGNPRTFAEAAETLAGNLMAAGKHEEALRLLEKIAPVADAYAGRTMRLRLRGMTAECKRKLGDLDAAGKIIADVLDEAYDLSQGVSAEQGAGARSNIWALFDIAVAVAVDAGDPEALYRFQEMGRAAVLVQSLGGARQVRLAVVPKSVRERFEQTQNKLRTAQLSVREAKRAGLLKVARRRRADVEAAQSELQKTLQIVERESTRAKELLRPAIPKLKDVQASLEPGEVFVSYSVIGEDSCALVVSHDSVRIVKLPVRRLVAAELDAVDFGDSEASVAQQVARLRKMLIEPLALDAKTKKLILCPNTPVAQVPFAALVPERPITYVPSMTVAMQLASVSRKAGTRILALGDPTYTGSLKPLPHTRAEAKAIGDVVLLGDDANRVSLTDALSRETSWRAVHFACHGIVDLQNPGLSGLALTDGQLRYFDILQMKIPADLVTLSGCETGKGKVVRSEGVFGLTRAFLSSGASRVLVSLWPVEDEATQVLMTDFYRRWKSGKSSPGEALQRAQAHLRGQKKWRHPAYWAAWQVWGAHK